jgi:hypothetical protein
MRKLYAKINHYLIISWVFLYALAYVVFFTPVMISIELLKGVSWIVNFITFLLSIPYLLKKNSSRYGLIMKLWVFTILFSFFTSHVIHDQGVLFTFRVILNALPFAFYFFMLGANLSIKQIEKFVLVFTLFYILVYFVALIAYPLVLFDYSQGTFAVNDSRGIARFKIYGSAFLHLSFFMTISKWLCFKEKKHLAFAGFCFLVIVLNVSRQHILFSFVLGLLMMFNHVKWYNKVLLLLLSVFFVYLVSQTTIFSNLIMLSTNQINNEGDNNIRILAFLYFFFEYNESISQVVLGNGIPHLSSSWGESYAYLMDKTGFILSDIGMAKIFIFWGGWGLILYFILSVKIVFQKVTLRYQYAKYYFIFIFCTTIGSHSFFTESMAVSIVIFILDRFNYISQKEEFIKY